MSPLLPAPSRVGRRTSAAVVAALVVVALLPGALFAAPPAAHAVTAASTAYDGFVPGDFTVAGNTLINGNSFAWSDQDATATLAPPASAGLSVASSRAGFTMPAGSHVVAAFLYAMQRVVTVAPVDLLVAPPGADYTVVSSAAVGNAGGYQMLKADVSTLFRGSGAGNVWVGVPSGPVATGNISSWGLFLVYETPGAMWRQIVINDQAVSIIPPGTMSATAPDLSVAPGGTADATIADYVFVSSVGDSDTLQVCAGSATCAVGAGTYASNALNPQNDVANMTFSVDGSRMPGAAPATPAGWAWSDLDLFRLSGALPAGTTSATITQRSTGDTLFAGVDAISTTVYTPLPTLTQSVSPAAGQLVGDVVTYSLTLSLGSGGDGASDVVVSDPLPSSVSFVPGSARVTSGIGQGAVTEASGDDAVDVSNGILTWRAGAGATAATGGQLAPTDGAQTLVFQARLRPQAGGTVVSNTAQATMVGALAPTRVVTSSATSVTALVPPAPAPPTVAPLTSSGTAQAGQTATAPLPSGGSAALVSNGSLVSSLTVPGEGTYQIDPATGVIQFTPILGFAGTGTPVTYSVTDAVGQSSTSTYTVTVSRPAAPVPSSLRITGPAGVPQRGTVAVPAGGSAALIDNGTLVSTLVVPGEGTYRIDPATGVIVFTPVAGFTGTAGPVTYSVTDAYGQSATSTFTVTATPVAGAAAVSQPRAAAGPATGTTRPGSAAASTAASLAATGATIGWAGGAAAVVALLTGTALLVRRRRQGLLNRLDERS